MKILKLSHTYRNYILCASISAMMVVWNITLAIAAAVSITGKMVSLITVAITLIDVVCIIKLSTKVATLKHHPVEEHKMHSKFAITTLTLAFLPTIIWAFMVRI